MQSNTPINNEFYGELGSRWYEAQDDPVALLRAENKTKLPWIIQRLKNHNVISGSAILDIGCGAGLATNPLAQRGYKVTGLDLAKGALEEARRRDQTQSVKYVEGNAYKLPFADEQFDAVMSLDFLEHVDEPSRVVAEASRVLKPGGVFFYHTFSKNWLAYLVVIKGIEWFVKNTPEHMHTYELFIDHKTLLSDLKANGLRFEEVTGLRPRLGKAFWSMLASGVVPLDFQFTTTRSTIISYLGYATKNETGV